MTTFCYIISHLKTDDVFYNATKQFHINIIPNININKSILNIFNINIIPNAVVGVKCRLDQNNNNFSTSYDHVQRIRIVTKFRAKLFITYKDRRRSERRTINSKGDFE